MGMDIRRCADLCIANGHGIGGSFDRANTVQIGKDLPGFFPQLGFDVGGDEDMVDRHISIRLRRVFVYSERVGGIHTPVGVYGVVGIKIFRTYYSSVDPLPRERCATLTHMGGWIMRVGGINTHVGGW